MQSDAPRNPPRHVAIVMDGNGRWATARGLPRPAGHQAGVETVRRIVEAAPGLGVETLTLYAFSSDNWRRPTAEVAALMLLLRRFVRAETGRLAEAGARLTMLGRRDRLPGGLAEAIAAAEQATAHGTRLHLRVALDYSARDAILDAARRAAALPALTRDVFARLLSGGDHAAEPAPDVDLLIRTGGEQRLSDFLLWECAYAELLFVPRLWPDFSAADLSDAVAWYAARERRFGGVGAGAPQPAPPPATPVPSAA
ncbi:di-trans,poly-cis-decaprenylcistransferase [Rhodoplanes sp. TEM]|uniref:Isoprenyl transferase n=1 Tax=Rhodoplanes tepidamans TaxID=200616 RepID=A0ABT5J467_RHOTP|nr:MULTISPECIES: di-trans,poly-cis-decaprenylcistransferase [Rhodoplanes]MDC7784441.1 di-trans,poly-cis-decaprenylcistransferase [Rhodoplanes tepidamans]MDC7983471.1 di-trans,poly-cis-decaprenylcistransferase [Rhodoplanes sp. TEM]